MNAQLHLGKPMAEKEPSTVERPPNKKGDDKRPPTVAEPKSSRVKTSKVKLPSQLSTAEKHGVPGQMPTSNEEESAHSWHGWTCTFATQ